MPMKTRAKDITKRQMYAPKVWSGQQHPHENSRAEHERHKEQEHDAETGSFKQSAADGRTNCIADANEDLHHWDGGKQNRNRTV